MAGETVPNMVIAKVGDDGRMALYNNTGSVDVVVDVLGWFSAGGSAFQALIPRRVLDTRQTSSLVGSTEMDVSIAGVGGVPLSGVGVVALNVTVTNPSGASFLTVWPTGVGRPTASNVNFVGGQTVPNMVIVKLGAGGRISLFSPTPSADVVIDVFGWFPAGGAFAGITPARLMDTRGAVAGVKGLSPGTSWQWQIDGGPIDETVLDSAANTKKMYYIDLFTSDAVNDPTPALEGHHGRVLHGDGWLGGFRPDAGSYPAAVLGKTLSGFPDERLVDIRRLDVLLPIIAARLDLAAQQGMRRHRTRPRRHVHVQHRVPVDDEGSNSPSTRRLPLAHRARHVGSG